jgi:hypothetical protein
LQPLRSENATNLLYGHVRCLDHRKNSSRARDCISLFCYAIYYVTNGVGIELGETPLRLTVYNLWRGCAAGGNQCSSNLAVFAGLKTSIWVSLFRYRRTFRTIGTETELEWITLNVTMLNLWRCCYGRGNQYSCNLDGVHRSRRPVMKLCANAEYWKGKYVYTPAVTHCKQTDEGKKTDRAAQHSPCALQITGSVNSTLH